MGRAFARVRLDPLRLALRGFQLPAHRLGLIDPDGRPRGEVLEHGSEADSEVRREPVHPFEIHALAHQLAHPRSLEISRESSAIERPEAGVEVLREENLAGGRDARPVDGGDGALGGDVEGPERRDLVAVEFDSHRVVHARPEYVQEAAAAAHLPHFPRLAHGSVARHDQPVRQDLGRDLGPALERNGTGANRSRSGREPVEGDEVEARTAPSLLLREYGEVEIEIAARRRDPREAPAHPAPVGVQVSQRST